MENLKDTLEEKKKELYNVNNVDKDINNNVDNVNSNTNKNVNNVKTPLTEKEKALQDFLHLIGDQPKDIARTIANELGDENHLNFHLKVARNNNAGKLFEALSMTNSAARKGGVRSKPRYYVWALKHLGAKW